MFWVELLIIIVGRFIGTVGLMNFLKLFGYDSGIPLRELIFIWYAGMIRGAIAFGLVLRIQTPNRNVIVTTSLSLVIFTTVVFGSTVGLVSKCLFKNQKKEKFEAKEKKKVIIEEEKIESPHERPLLNETKRDDDGESIDESSAESSSDCEDSNYQRLLHPNEEDGGGT